MTFEVKIISVVNSVAYPEFRIRNPVLVVPLAPDLESKISFFPDPGSRILYLEFWIPDLGSCTSRSNLHFGRVYFILKLFCNELEPFPLPFPLPVPFLVVGSGIRDGKKSGSGINIPDL
jgi:hypothetical protein